MEQRLIDANALIKWLTSPTGFQTACEDCQSFGSECVKCIVAEAIENSPTIDPVKHGRWIYKFDGQFYQTSFICPNCNYKRKERGYTPEDDGWNYCPVCGMKM